MRKTSIKAFQSISLESKKSTWSKIVKALKRRKAGATYDEIATLTGLEPVQVARRMNELVEAKIVINTPITRATRTGRKAMVRTLSKKYAA